MIWLTHWRERCARSMKLAWYQWSHRRTLRVVDVPTIEGGTLRCWIRPHAYGGTIIWTKVVSAQSAHTPSRAVT